MRLLMVAELWKGSTATERARIFEHLGFEVLPFDITPYHARLSRVEQSVASRFNISRTLPQLNRALAALASESDYDAVWVTKGNWLYPSTVTAIRERARRKFAIHHTNDALIYKRMGSRYFFGSIPCYDLFVTTKPWEMEMYRARGVRDVDLVLHAHGRQFSPDAKVDVETRRAFTSDISFIGHYESRYATHVKAIAKAFGDGRTIVKVWGPNWPRYAKGHAWARGLVQGNGIWGEGYPQALSCAKIAIGLLTSRWPETSTSRNFEIPASGTFMLAERTDELLRLFDEGKEAEFFSSPEEMCDKAQFYLRHDAERARIAAAGHERCVRSGYSTVVQMRKLFERIAAKGYLELPASWWTETA